MARPVTALNKEAIQSTWRNMLDEWEINFGQLKRTKRYRNFTRQVGKRMRLKNELIILNADGTVTFKESKQ